MSNRTVRRRTSGIALALSMPDQTIRFLILSSAGLFTLYIGLVIFTITLATMQTSLAAQVRATEGSIAELETTYYAALARENGTTPASVGLVAPADVEYAIEKPAPGLSFARN